MPLISMPEMKKNCKNKTNNKLNAELVDIDTFVDDDVWYKLMTITHITHVVPDVL